jgi:quercetin dioxygenase-like cupin family protein
MTTLPHPTAIRRIAWPILAAAFLTLPLAAQEPPTTPTMTPTPHPLIEGSVLFNWDSLAGKPTAIGYYRQVVDAAIPTMDRFEMHVTTLNPGNSPHPPHHHPQEELILIKEGTLESSINGHKDRVGPGSVLFFASNDVHNVMNVGEKPATYYVINFYTPATASVRNQAAAEWAPPGMLKSCAMNWDALKPTAMAAGVKRYSYVDSPTLTYARLEIHATTMPPGVPASAVHHHPWLEVIVIREGSIEFNLNGVRQTGGPGSIMYIAPNTLQSSRNPGTVPATYTVFMVAPAASVGPAGS